MATKKRTGLSDASRSRLIGMFQKGGVLVDLPTPLVKYNRAKFNRMDSGQDKYMQKVNTLVPKPHVRLIEDGQEIFYPVTAAEADYYRDLKSPKPLKRIYYDEG